MARFELKLPKMGESVAEATITAWLKDVGDLIELDEAVVEIARTHSCVHSATSIMAAYISISISEIDTASHHKSLSAKQPADPRLCRFDS